MEIKIQNIIGNVLKQVTIKDNNLSIAESVFFNAIDPDLRYYIKVVDVTKNTLFIGVTNNIVFSEIIGFKKKQIEQKILGELNKLGIKEIKYKLY